MERFKIRWSFLITSDQDLKKAREFAKDNGFSDLPRSVKIGNYLVFNTNKGIQICDNKVILDRLSIRVFDTLNESCIKPEFHSDFKRMFRVNRVPDELSSVQIHKLTEEKVLELWKY